MQLWDMCCFSTKRLCACYLLIPTDRPLWPKYPNVSSCPSPSLRLVEWRLRASARRCLTAVEVDKGSELLRWWMFGHIRGFLESCLPALADKDGD
jgi:hypothetical protein